MLVEIKENTAKGRAMIEMLKTMDFVKIIDPQKPNETTLKAMEEAEKGGLKRHKTVSSFMKSLDK